MKLYRNILVFFSSISILLYQIFLNDSFFYLAILNPILFLFNLKNSWKQMKIWDLVGVVTSWGSSNDYSSFSPISSHCGGL